MGNAFSEGSPETSTDTGIPLVDQGPITAQREFGKFSEDQKEILSECLRMFLGSYFAPRLTASDFVNDKNHEIMDSLDTAPYSFIEGLFEDQPLKQDNLRWIWESLFSKEGQRLFAMSMVAQCARVVIDGNISQGSIIGSDQSLLSSSSSDDTISSARFHQARHMHCVIRMKIVPGRMAERSFWMRYFQLVMIHYIKLVKFQEGMNEDDGREEQREEIEGTSSRVLSSSEKTATIKEEKESRAEDAIEVIVSVDTKHDDSERKDQPSSFDPSTSKETTLKTTTPIDSQSMSITESKTTTTTKKKKRKTKKKKHHRGLPPAQEAGPHTDADGSDPWASIEEVLLEKPSVWLYAIPAHRFKGRTNAVREWDVGNPLWTGKLRIVASHRGTVLKLVFIQITIEEEDQSTTQTTTTKMIPNNKKSKKKKEEVFLTSVDIPLTMCFECQSNNTDGLTSPVSTTVVDRSKLRPLHSYFDMYGVIDSSRFFVFWVVTPAGKRVPFGMGMRERQDAFDIRARMNDHIKVVRRQMEIDRQFEDGKGYDSDSESSIVASKNEDANDEDDELLELVQTNSGRWVTKEINLEDPEDEQPISEHNDEEDTLQPQSKDDEVDLNTFKLRPPPAHLSPPFASSFAPSVHSVSSGDGWTDFQEGI